VRGCSGGDIHVPDKVLSVFEPHTETTRKGKIAKPTEFGKLVTIQESEQIITAYEVHDRRPPDTTLWTPALDRHIPMFDRPPDIAAGDRGFSSASNDAAAIARGVRRVILPRPGCKTSARRAHERQRWFRRGHERVAVEDTDQMRVPADADLLAEQHERHGIEGAADFDVPIGVNCALPTAEAREALARAAGAPRARPRRSGSRPGGASSRECGAMRSSDSSAAGTHSARRDCRSPAPSARWI
jgi:hypothetical protein